MSDEDEDILKAVLEAIRARHALDKQEEVGEVDNPLIFTIGGFYAIVRQRGGKLFGLARRVGGPESDFEQMGRWMTFDDALDIAATSVSAELDDLKAVWARFGNKNSPSFVLIRGNKFMKRTEDWTMVVVHPGGRRGHRIPMMILAKSIWDLNLRDPLTGAAPPEEEPEKPPTEPEPPKE